MGKKGELKEQGEAGGVLTEEEKLVYIFAYVHSVIMCYLRIIIFVFRL